MVHFVHNDQYVDSSLELCLIICNDCAPQSGFKATTWKPIMSVDNARIRNGQSLPVASLLTGRLCPLSVIMHSYLPTCSLHASADEKSSITVMVQCRLLGLGWPVI